MTDLYDRVNDPLVAKMKVSAAVGALPGVGKKRTVQIMNTAGVHPTRRFGGLTARQRDDLIDALHAWNFR